MVWLLGTTYVNSQFGTHGLLETSTEVTLSEQSIAGPHVAHLGRIALPSEG